MIDLCTNGLYTGAHIDCVVPSQRGQLQEFFRLLHHIIPMILLSALLHKNIGANLSTSLLAIYHLLDSYAISFHGETGTFPKNLFN